MKYFHKDSKIPLYHPVPCFLVNLDLKANTKMIYGRLLGRTILSIRSGWFDEMGRAYVIYTVEDIAKDMGCSVTTVKSALNELEKVGLIERRRRGACKANHIYLKMPKVDMYWDGREDEVNISMFM
ncbi:MAG: replication initiator protein A [Clostridia bacterium]|nr:replication initiator protein A [Clostridia bacterium]MBQ7086419.1 replication initiator protein A [Clostridia bacterium]